MSRARNLSGEDVAKIVGILDGWSGRLTWDALLDSVERHLFARYTRQALHRHTRIQAAFEQRKRKLAEGGGSPRRIEAAPEMQVAMDRIALLEAQLQRVCAENTRLLEQFARWAYNASVRGLDDVYLNSPLPSVNGGTSAAGLTTKRGGPAVNKR
ncbi:hypothetical protein JWH16_13380 [Xanthomonas campestris pv. campestris]|uniref:hypothetical protein n=1 Tax=Xanthomonas campestris TaxID=339 RepID=UPI001E538E11|nr:hypothetical protein [Xanthomonas campestris]MCD0254780.1 hypothetical protein [Xanthomonas campestris pv. campestris]MEB1300182.1 hypothetical protein [Xanthomonas campestris pv. campestris]MEB1308976.1 hypothetical protein [Xanthomonas campestris pv. campestris]MEB1334093.1 hypothetical protein [Xanthomonas campestris pv. campestris]MEB1899981.1 hypothetical protein [Xanthomonas campestris pv. campestris]